MKKLKISQKKNRMDRSVLTRRGFLKSSAFLGGGTVGLSLLGLEACTNLSPEEKVEFNYELQKAENQIYTSCLQCHNACSIKGKLYNGLLGKIDGNPYSPQNMLPHIDNTTSIFMAAKVDGKCCGKSQSGIQTLYDPYRLRKVLKRAGKRGENKWITVDFNQAIEEIVNGGDLFGEGNVSGLKDIYVLKDSKLAGKMAGDTKKFGKGEITLGEFKSKYANNLDVLIDPDHPDLGPKNNKFIMMCGRIEHGRKELGKRFTSGSFGSNNFFEHTTICEQSHHIAYQQLTNNWVVSDGKGKWTGGKTHLKPDLMHSKFVIFFGTGAFEANFGKTAMAQKVTDSMINRNFKMAVVDPRLSETAAKANWWIPIKPGTDAAFAYCMIRWMFENEKYDKPFLSNANLASAGKTGEKSITDATILVKIEDGRGSKYLRASEVGLGKETEFVTMVGGKAVKVDPNDKTSPVKGDLFSDTNLKGIKVKSSLQLVKEKAISKTLQQWADICDIDVDIILEIAEEFTSHGKMAAVEFYRGPVQHTNGYYSALALIYLNMMIGNIDWLGGLQKGGGHWHEFGDKGGYFNLAGGLHPDKLSAFGPPITREKARYEDTSLFRENGYPAKRNWYPYSSNIYQEIIASMEDAYPYKADVLFIHKGTPLLATPAGHKYIQYVSDPKKLPLFFTCDIVIGETSMYADYIFPDITYLERWGTPHIPPDVAQKISKIRQPVVSPIPEIVTIDGEDMPISLEAIYLAIANKLGLSGFGKNGFDDGLDFVRPEDWYLKLCSNIAKGDKAGEELPKADNKEIELFGKARNHLPGAIFDENKWKKAVKNNDEIWSRTVYLLNRGCRTANYETITKSAPYTSSQLKGFMKFFIENVAQGKNSITGKNFNGIAIYEEIMSQDGVKTGFENRKEGELFLNTFKEVFAGHSRTVSNYWSQLSIRPENVIRINKKDADELGFNDGDIVRIVSDHNPSGEIDLLNGEKIFIKGMLKVIQGLRPGVVSIAWHYGHWAYGGNDVIVDGKLIKGDKRRHDSLCPNPIMAVDTKLKNMCLTDPIGASASFYDTKVKLIKT